MITTLAITAAIVVIVVLIGMWSMYAAFGHCIPDGFEDDEGFHHGKPD